MDKNIKKIVDLVNNPKNLEDEQRFKIASATLVYNIIGTDNKNSKKYSSLFQENFNLEQDELNRIKATLQEDNLNIDYKIHYIKTELDNNMYQVMQFLKILNKFAILDGCNQKNYREFELIRDKFLKDHY